eukprot:3331553-Pyramimonas_sp.AAC.1
MADRPYEHPREEPPGAQDIRASVPSQGRAAKRCWTCPLAFRFWGYFGRFASLGTLDSSLIRSLVMTAPM